MIDIIKTVEKIVNDNAQSLAKSHQQKIYAFVVSRFDQTRKKPLSDLPQLIQSMHDRIKQMTQDLKIVYQSGKLVVKTSGSAEETLKVLQRGTTWFEPLPELGSEIVGIVFKQ